MFGSHMLPGILEVILELEHGTHYWELEAGTEFKQHQSISVRFSFSMLSHDGRPRLPIFSNASVKIAQNDYAVSFSFEYTFAEHLIKKLSFSTGDRCTWARRHWLRWGKRQYWVGPGRSLAFRLQELDLCYQICWRWQSQHRLSCIRRHYERWYDFFPWRCPCLGV